MESPSSIYMLFHFCRIMHNACRLRLPRIWNPSLSPDEDCIGVAISVKTIHAHFLLQYQSKSYYIIGQEVYYTIGRFITLSGNYYIIGRFLLHYRARITVSGVYYIIGWYNSSDSVLPSQPGSSSGALLAQSSFRQSALVCSVPSLLLTCRTNPTFSVSRQSQLCSNVASYSRPCFLISWPSLITQVCDRHREPLPGTMQGNHRGDNPK